MEGPFSNGIGQFQRSRRNILDFLKQNSNNNPKGGIISMKSEKKCDKSGD